MTANPRRLGVLAPFGFHDYRLLWLGLFVSNIGTWMQLTALGYLLVQMAPNPRMAALYVGILGAAAAIPSVLLSPIAGMVADRFPRRRILTMTNTLSSLSALTLALLLSFHLLSVWEIFLLESVRAGAQAFDAPARQSWVPLLVPREFVGNAIGLNSIAFNAPAVIGPPIAGLLILSIGIAMSFYINAVATLAVVVALLFMQPAPPSSTKREPPLRSIQAGLAFLFTHPILRSIVLQLVLICLLVRPYLQLLPAYAANVVHVDARGLGMLFAASGLGAIGGASITAIVGSHRRGMVWFVSAALVSVGAILLGSTQAYALALPTLTLLGLGMLSFVGSSNVLLQTLSPDDMRGRVISVFSMVILGIVPSGSLLLGGVATLVGLSHTILAGGVIAFLMTLATYLTNPALREV